MYRSNWFCGLSHCSLQKIKQDEKGRVPGICKGQVEGKKKNPSKLEKGQLKSWRRTVNLNLKKGDSQEIWARLMGICHDICHGEVK